MKSMTVSNKLIASATFAVAFLFTIITSPAHVAAQTVPGAIQTGELLPPGKNACQSISITSIQPYVYNGVLESFDVTISDTDNSYVGIIAQVGNTPIPLNFISRWAGVPNGLRIHVDTPNISVSGALPITLTLLSSPANSPTCVTTVMFDVSRSESASVPQPNTSASTSYSQHSNNTTPVTSSNKSPVPPSTRISSVVGKNSKPSVSTSSIMAGSGTSTVGASAASVSSTNFFNSVCLGNNAYRLWFVLLLIYVIIVAIVVFAEPWFLESSVIGSTAAILVPLILLLAFWYLSASCRAASWIPVVACVIAIIGLFLAFREYELPPLLPAPSDQ